MVKKSSLVIILSLIFSVIMILVLLGYSTGMDMFFYNAVRSVSSNFFDNYFIYLTKLGNTGTVLIVLILLNILLNKKEAITCDVLSAISVLSNSIIKHIIRRDRPDILRLIKQGGYSFPSGHSMISVTLYGYLLYLVITKVKNEKLKMFLSFILSVIISTVCISRIYVGVHYFTDVFCGIILGVIELLVIIPLCNKYIKGGVDV